MDSEVIHRDSPDIEFYTPMQLAERWQCARSTVDRIARRAGITRYCFGTGRNGIVRYHRKEVAQYEAKCRA